jgi:NAD(P)-dependent dehydrogenase (short-subunit alcohol dehydrogenase family)
MTRTTELDGKHIVITGGTGALGNAVTALLCARGAIAHLPMIEPEPPADFRLADHDRVQVAPGIDLRDEQQVRAYYGRLPPLHGSIHVAGGFAMAPVTDTSAADLRAMFDLNTVTCFLGCREAARNMRAAGAGGRIVNVGARPAVEPAAGMIAYAVSKAAVAHLTRCLAAELRADDIAVNAVLPSTIDTPQNRAGMPDADFDAWPKPEQIAETIAFLVSPASSLTSGALIPVYGGA